jgi:hypothetical protein
MAQSRDDRAGRGARTKSRPQSGSKRPKAKVGAASPAPKKGTIEPKGTARPGAAAKSRPGKAGGARKAQSKKPSTPRGR